MVQLALLDINAAQRLKDSETNFRALVDAVQDYAIFRLDRDGCVVTWNRGAQRISGYTAREILGRNYACFYPPADVARDKPSRHLGQAAYFGRYEDHGWRLRKDGTRFWAEVVISALRDENGHLQGFAKVTRDVSERKQAEDLVRQREHVLDSFFSASSVGMAILDCKLRYQRVNETLAEINGVPPALHLGKTVREVIPGLADEVEPRMLRVLASGMPILNEELCGPIPGTPDLIGYWNANYFPLRNEAGEIAQLGVVIVDITKRRRAEESLRRLSGRLMELQDQERRRIARELHDGVGQALTAIKLNLALATQGLQGSVSAKALDALRECEELASQCAVDTRTISYLLHPPLLDERGLASAVRWYIDGFARRSAIAVSLDLPEGETRLVQQHETALFRVLQEGLTNIHRHSGSPTASVSLIRHRDNLTLRISDQGHGMPASSLRACHDATCIPGVGIAGMRERMRQLGGQLDIESNERGTTVTATLPLGGQL
jgi:PAS domain S-box-containing protein